MFDRPYTLFHRLIHTPPPFSPSTSFPSFPFFLNKQTYASLPYLSPESSYKENQLNQNPVLMTYLAEFEDMRVERNED